MKRRRFTWRRHRTRSSSNARRPPSYSVRSLAAKATPASVQAAWALTGETRNWNAANGVFSGPKPAKPLSLDDDGWGALELAVRHSFADLKYREELLPAAGGIRGSEQEAWTPGLNSYVNNNIRFLLDYQFVEVDRLSSGAANAFGDGVIVPAAAPKSAKTSKSFRCVPSSHSDAKPYLKEFLE